MARASLIQSNFGAGEFSPTMYGRVDADRYKAGLAKCFNAVPLLQGPITRRAGTKYIATTAILSGNSQPVRLVPFKFSNGVNYIIEVGNLYMRFYTNRGVVESSPGVPYQIDSPFEASEIKDIKFAQSLDTMYIVHPRVKPQKLQRFNNTDWTIGPVVFKDGPYFNANTDPRLAIVPTSSSGDAVSVNVFATAVTITAVSNNGTGHPRLTTSTNNYITGDYIYIPGLGPQGIPSGVYRITSVDSTHIDLLTTPYVSSATGLSVGMNFAVFKDAAIGQLIRMLEGTIWGWGVIIAVNSPVEVTIDIKSDLGGTGDKRTWRLGTFGVGLNPLDPNDPQWIYPNCVVFHEDRLYFGGSGGALQRIDGSRVSDYENFAPSEFIPPGVTDNTVITAASAVSFALQSYSANRVTWMTSDERGMPIGTEGGPWVLRPSVLSEAITATNISAKKVISHPCSNLTPVVAGKATLYIEKSTRVVRELSYFYNIDAFSAVDLSELSSHLPAQGIYSELVFQETPQNIAWCSRNDGALLGMTYDRTLDALRTGWHVHQLGGVGDVFGGPPLVTSLAVIPSPDGLTDDVWMAVQRYINGETIFSIEYMTPLFQNFMAPEEAFFVDCGSTYDNPVSIQNFTSGTTTTMYAPAHGLSTGDRVRFAHFNAFGIPGAEFLVDESSINGPLFSITRIDANYFSVPFDSVAEPLQIAGNQCFRKAVHTISGLDYLEGETVTILGDGAVIPSLTVSSGTITLPANTPGVCVANIGLPYSTQIQQLRLEGGSQDGTSIGKVRRPNEFAIMVDRSASFEYGVNFDSMAPVPLRNVTDDGNDQVPLFSGIIDQLLPESDYDLDGQLCFRQSDPLPLTILAIMPQQVVNDKT